MRTKLIGAMLLAMLTLSTKSSAQAEAIYAPMLIQALNGPLGDLVGQFCPGCSHTTWVAIYQDGTQVFNDFQSRRGPTEVANYFAGYTSGDCDSHDRSGRTFCYRGQAEAYGHIAQHGRITDIQMLDRHDHWRSLLALAGQYWGQ